MDKTIDALKQDLLNACRILVALGLDSGPFGNLSVRLSSEEGYLQNPNGITFENLKFSDILKVRADGSVSEGKHSPHPGEFIHREIYRLRHDVGAIVHTHSPNTVTLSLLETLIEPFTQLGSSLYGDQGLYLGFTGPVRDSNEGRAIAEALGSGSVVIAKNHGLFAVGKDLPSALWNFVVADEASRIHLDAKRVGLANADLVDKTTVLKSKIEVREKQAHLMWANYLSKISLRQWPQDEQALGQPDWIKPLFDKPSISRREKPEETLDT